MSCQRVSRKRVSNKREFLSPCVMQKRVAPKSVSFAGFHAKETHESETGDCDSIGIERLSKRDT